jgi:hypothetical protein
MTSHDQQRPDRAAPGRAREDRRGLIAAVMAAVSTTAAEAG